MGPDLENSGRLENIMDVSPNKENESNYKDDIFEMEASLHGQDEQVNKAGQVNITECTNNPGKTPMVETESEDATEYSSSYGNTASGDKTDAMLSDPEVVSKLRGDAFSEVFRKRKKRLTSHWKTFVQSQRWRFKWVELQLRRLQAQASKYDLQLEEYKPKRRFNLDDFTVEDLGEKSTPFPNHNRREKIIKRKKRKRLEDTIDKEAYMARHNLFSYTGNRKSTADLASIDDDDWGNQADEKTDANVSGVSDEPILLDFRDGANNSLEKILWKIGVAQEHVSELRNRINTVMIENAEEISAAEKLSLNVSCNNNALTGSTARKHAELARQSSRIREGDLFMPESAFLTHDEVTHISESTRRSQAGILNKKIGDGDLIYNLRATEELNNSFDEVRVQPLPLKKLKVPKEEQEINTVPSVGDDEPNTSKIRSISQITSSPKNTRKRGRRKAGRWNR